MEVSDAGYVVHSRTTRKGRIYLHRVVAKAGPGEVVHHINGDKTDNRPENLEVMTQAEHCKLHAPHIARWGSPVSVVCLMCGSPKKLRRGLCSKHYQKSRYKRKNNV